MKQKKKINYFLSLDGQTKVKNKTKGTVNPPLYQRETQSCHPAAVSCRTLLLAEMVSLNEETGREEAELSCNVDGPAQKKQTDSVCGVSGHNLLQGCIRLSRTERFHHMNLGVAC